MAQLTLRLGTRRSALARAQSSAVARCLEALHPGLGVELVGIDTRGDRISDVPLSQVDGKAFFTAEIDAALQRGAVDLTVHSFKDLSLERPADLYLAAVPQRENPRDLVVFAPDILEHLASGAPVRIGSSSPRRAALVPDFLARALPGNPVVQRCELRGNVDTRLRRVREPRGAERQLDGVVLALAGLTRLARDESLGGRAMVATLLAGTRRMVLPLTACPGAPAQGALAIECRAADTRTRTILAALDDAPTRAAVAAERAQLAARGGGCHQRFGATQVELAGLGALLYMREDGAIGSDERRAPRPLELHWTAAVPLPPLPAQRRAWDGSVAPPPAASPLADAAARAAQALQDAPALFVTHRRALPELPPAAINACPHVWVPGTESWYALAARGIWIEGCAEGLGFAALAPLLTSPLLGLPPADAWCVFTHAGAEPHWSAGQTVATYALADATGAAPPPRDATHYYWHSGAQFERWRHGIASDAHHACGPGKTAGHLKAAGIGRLDVFPSAAQWRAWVGP
ncbi:MAG: hydroxymethylbilane synthase [Gammaproteobacteria bacterium]|nr:hydroxymethylbilane synthase [Gammaproteobacteria bacterium]